MSFDEYITQKGSEGLEGVIKKFDEYKDKVVFKNFSSENNWHKDAILDTMRLAYVGSKEFRNMLDTWFNNNPTITINFEKGVTRVKDKNVGFGVVDFDLESTHGRYIDNNGNTVEHSLFSVFVHELSHALTGKKDNVNYLRPSGGLTGYVQGELLAAGDSVYQDWGKDGDFSDYRQPNVTHVNIFFREINYFYKNINIFYEQNGISGLESRGLTNIFEQLKDLHKTNGSSELLAAPELNSYYAQDVNNEDYKEDQRILQRGYKYTNNSAIERSIVINSTMPVDWDSSTLKDKHGNYSKDNKERDLLIGDHRDNKLTSGGGNDFLYGQGGDDHLFGGTGNDYLNGGEDDDHLYGDGDDIISGTYEPLREFRGQSFNFQFELLAAFVLPRSSPSISAHAYNLCETPKACSASF